MAATPGPWFIIKISSYQYRKFYLVDKTVVRSSYLHNGISYTGKMSSLYWIGALIAFYDPRQLGISPLTAGIGMMGHSTKQVRVLNSAES